MYDTHPGITPQHADQPEALRFGAKLIPIPIFSSFGAGISKRPLSLWPLRMFLLVAALQLAGVAEADSSVPAHNTPQRSTITIPIGSRTSQLLELQRGNSAAAPRRPMFGPVADVVWQRYLKSFEHPIPNLYRDADASMRR